MIQHDKPLFFARTLIGSFVRDTICANFYGSTYINGSGKDIDFLVLVANRPSAIESLERGGWTRCGAEYDTDEFTAVRKGDINLIVTDRQPHYVAMHTACEALKFLRGVDMSCCDAVESKAIRIAVHEIAEDAAYSINYAVEEWEDV